MVQRNSPDPAAFRSAMRRAVSGVTIVTTRHDGRPWGMTVNAFTSVCAEPPTVLVCVNNRTVTAADITGTGRFAVNLLSQDQLFLSRLCARAGEVKYLDDYILPEAETPGPPAVAATMPVLRDSLVTFDCAVTEAHAIGSHFVVIGTVETIIAPAPRDPLLYGQGWYMHGVSISQSPAMIGTLAWV